MKTIMKTYLTLVLMILGFAVNAQDKPNIIFIMTDDLNDYQGSFGGHPQAKTPNIDRLAESGVRFMNAQSNIPLCQPSRNSFMTGIHPWDSKDFLHKADYFDQPVLKNSKTFVQLLNENGYQTLGSGKISHKEPAIKEWQEWGVTINHYGPYPYNGTENVVHPDVPEPFRSIGSINGSFGPIESTTLNFSDDVTATWRYNWHNDQGFLTYTDADNRDLLPDEMHAKWAVEKIEALDNSGSSEPFFMGVGFASSHTPLHVPKRFFDMFPVEDLEVPERLEGDLLDTHFAELYPNTHGLRYFDALKASYGNDTDLAIKTWLQAYLASVAFMDEQVGKVIDALDNSSFKDNTVVIFASDHGWHVGEKDYLFKNSPWGESLRVPFIIRDPREAKGTQVHHPISLVDIYPTIVDLGGLEGDTKKNDEGTDLSGHSLVPFLKNADTDQWDGPEGALSVMALGVFSTGIEKIDQTYSYRTEDWRYIRYPNGKEELYNHTEDPHEWNNLADTAQYAATKNELKKQVEEIVGIVYLEEVVIAGWEDFVSQGEDNPLDYSPTIKSNVGIDAVAVQTAGWEASDSGSNDGTYGTFDGASTATEMGSVLKSTGGAQSLSFTFTNQSKEVINGRHLRFDMIAEEQVNPNYYTVKMQKEGETSWTTVKNYGGAMMNSSYPSAQTQPEPCLDLYQNIDAKLIDVVLNPNESITFRIILWKPNVFIDNVALTGTIPGLVVDVLSADINVTSELSITNPNSER